ncbi:MAG TPA: carboxypeptidase-like regulatory domain-containing protein [Gemmatimonadaceae bacterium]|nr:carboxypeptidase-like regulatory domain-containing protein [Gemmatimonadaceae bacterium]
MAIPRACRRLFLVAALAGNGVGALSGQQPTAPLDTTRRDSLPAVLVGHVTDSAGTGLPGAEVTLFHSTTVRAITGDSGDFRVTGVPAGTNVFNVRRIGFEAASFTAVLKSGKTHRATFKLTESAHALPTVAVSDTAIPTHWLDQFERRKSGSRGTFFTRKDIERKGARSGVDIVRTVPGVRVVPVRGGGYQILMSRGSGANRCIPTTFVHNQPYSGTLDDFTAEDVEALEVYVGISEIPPEFDKGGKGVCAVIVIWTRDPRKAP